MSLKYPTRVSLVHTPTRLEKLERLSKYLGGPDIYIKRDDQTGLATGGNKARKLEFLVADALAKGCDHLVTIGSPQSNHCRQTAAAAAKFGLGCALVLSGEASSHDITGNLLLDRLLGAHLYWAGERNRQEVMAEVVAELRVMGRQPYPIPLGGSNVWGATGYVLAMEELMAQITADHLNLDFIVHASSSGGTQAGMIVGAEAHNFRGQILGISIDTPVEELQTHVAALATATATHLGLSMLPIASKVQVNDDYLGDGYAQIGETEREAIQLMAHLEGILLDPVYTGRAMGGLIDLIRWGAFTRGQAVLFWHTGGTAALPAFAHKLI
jgi:D-cysteine desulfhydrase